MNTENTLGLETALVIDTMESIKTRHYWQQRCAKAERELEHTIDSSHRKSVWIELAWRVLNHGVVGQEEIDYLLEQLADIARQGGE